MTDLKADKLHDRLEAIQPDYSSMNTLYVVIPETLQIFPKIIGTMTKDKIHSLNWYLKIVVYFSLSPCVFLIPSCYLNGYCNKQVVL